jgi:hypothetical protein
MLWWWCLDYAIDGDLSKKEAYMIEEACKIPLKVLIKSGFVDSRPYRRIHSWYEIQGNYLRSRFKDTPEKWQRIKHLYENDLPMSLHRLNGEGNPSWNNPRSPADVQNRTERTDVRNVRTDSEKTFTREASGLGPSGQPLPAPAETAGLVDDQPMTPEDMKAIRIKNMGDWKK